MVYPSPVVISLIFEVIFNIFDNINVFIKNKICFDLLIYQYVNIFGDKYVSLGAVGCIEDIFLKKTFNFFHFIFLIKLIELSNIACSLLSTN